MRECDKRKSSVISKHHTIKMSSNNIESPVTKTFTTLQLATLHSASLYLLTINFYPFKLHPTTLYYTSLPSHSV
jgi:hypothetical protein